MERRLSIPGSPLLARVAALVLPPRCPACGTIVEADHRFCGDCWRELRLLGPPWCATCALPFDFDRGPAAQCGACLSDPPPHAGARAAVAYGPVARGLALKLKYGGRAAFAETAAGLMRRLVPGDAELFVPVPLHRWRLWSRGYNQAGLIAAALSRACGVPVARAALVRVRATPVLKGMGRSARARAVASAFRIAPGAQPVVRGRHVVLIDDVYTTGATASACARVLARAGAAKVTVLTWARVVAADGGEAAQD